MHPQVSTRAPASFPAWVQSYSRALMLRTATYLLMYHARKMRDLHLDTKAVAYLEQEADALARQLDTLDSAFPPATVPALFEGFSRALALHTGAFLLEHHAITLRGLQVDPQAVAYLEQAAQAVEQEMDEHDATFPDLLNNAVLEVLRPFTFSGIDEKVQV